MRLALAAAAAFWFASFAPRASASGPGAWAALDRDSATACAKAAGLRDARVGPATVRFSDGFGMDARIVTGIWPQPHMNNAPVAMLCLYDRRAKRAEAQELPAAFALPPVGSAAPGGASTSPVAPPATAAPASAAPMPTPANAPAAFTGASYRCGGETFRVSFDETGGRVEGPDGAIGTLTRLPPTAADAPDVRVYTNGRMTFRVAPAATGLPLAYAKGRMAFVPCSPVT